MNEPASLQKPAAAPGTAACKWDLYPDGHRCPRVPAPRRGARGPRPDYCEQADGPDQPVHNPANAWRARQRLRDAAQADRAADARPPGPTMTRARLTGTELLQSAGVYADRLEAIVAELREALAGATDPAAAEAEIEGIRAAADQLVEAADQRARQADQRAAGAEQFAEAANAAAEQMSEDLTAAQTAAADADTAREEADRQADTAREEAGRQVSAAREEAAREIEQARREAAREIEEARREASELIKQAQGERDQAVQNAAKAGEAARLSEQQAAAAKTAAEAAGQELARYRDDTEKMLTQLHADAERERAQISAAWEGRAERDADEIGRLRHELDQIRAAAGGDNAPAGTGPSAPRRRSRPRRRPAATERDQA